MKSFYDNYKQNEITILKSGSNYIKILINKKCGGIITLRISLLNI